LILFILEQHKERKEGRDAGREAGREAGRQGGSQAGREAGMEPGRDAGMEGRCESSVAFLFYALYKKVACTTNILQTIHVYIIYLEREP